MKASYRKQGDTDMKKLYKKIGVILALTMVIGLIPAQGVNAAKAKSNVTYSIKKGTLVIKGKGKMPAKMTFKNNKKIKKVVIRKGVTSVSDKAFYKCKNLKKVTISGTVTKIGKYSFYGTKIKNITIPEKVGKIGQNALGKCKKLKTITMLGNLKVMLDSNEDYSAAVLMSGSNVKTVKFNTAFEPAMASYCEAENLQVMAKDKKYKSINGMVYTKDGKKLVRVPMNRKTVNVNDGCEEICLSALLYEKKIPDDFPQTCGDFSEITIPKSVTKINDTEYTTSQVYYSWNGKKYTKTKVKGVYEYIPNNENYNLKITIKDGNENNISILNKYFKKANIIK